MVQCSSTVIRFNKSPKLSKHAYTLFYIYIHLYGYIYQVRAQEAQNKPFCHLYIYSDKSTYLCVAGMVFPLRTKTVIATIQWSEI